MQKLVLAITSDFSRLQAAKSEAAKHYVQIKYIDTINDALEALANNDYALVAIGADGIEYMTKLKIMRELKPMPIIIFSYTCDKVSESVNALKAGADVFIATPFALEYIIESGLALIRMYERLGGQKRLKPGSILTNGHIVLSTQMRSVFVNGEEVSLSKIEFDILHLLMVTPGHVVTYERIFRRIWRNEHIDDMNSMLWNHISRLRKKIKVDPDSPEYILTVKEIGYKLNRNID